MKEIKIFLNKDDTIDINTIEFEGVVAGQISKGKIYIYNNIEYPLNIELSLTGKNIEIIKTINQLNPKQTKEVIFEFNPKITLMKPITAKLNIKIEYIIL